MCMKNGGRGGWTCLPEGVLRIAGTVLAVVGAVLIIVFVPLRYWMALIGLAFLLVGIYIRMNC